MKSKLLILCTALALFCAPAASAQTNVKVLQQPAAGKYHVTRSTASTTASTWIAQRLQRRAVTLYNLDAAITVYFKEVGSPAVTSSNGFPLGPGQSKVVNTTAAIQVIAASGTPALVADEEYD